MVVKKFSKCRKNGIDRLRNGETSPLCALAFNLLKPPSYAREKHIKSTWKYFSMHGLVLILRIFLIKKIFRVVLKWVWKNNQSNSPAGFSVVSLPGSSRLWHSLSRLPRFPSPLKLLRNHQATQANMLLMWVIRWPSDGWRLAKFVFVCLWTKTELSFINTQKGKSQYSAILPSRLVNKRFVV